MHQSVLDSRKGYEGKKVSHASVLEGEAPEGLSDLKELLGEKNLRTAAPGGALILCFHLWVGSPTHIRSGK